MSHALPRFNEKVQELFNPSLAIMALLKKLLAISEVAEQLLSGNM